MSEDNSRPREYPERPKRYCRFCSAVHVAYRAEFRRHIRQCQEIYWNQFRAKHGRTLVRWRDWFKSQKKKAA